MTNQKRRPHDVSNEKIEPVVGENKATEADDKLDDVVETKIVIGVVTNCARLNIRKEPKIDARVLVEIPVHSKLIIDQSNSTSEWLNVCTETGIKGFCMKKFITISQ